MNIPIGSGIRKGRRSSSTTGKHRRRLSKSLHSLGVSIDIRRLPAGDYAIGDRILVERKTTRDFLDTLVNRDLLGQVRSLSSSCLRPVMIIEGEDLYGERNIHPNAIRGTLSAITIDLGVTVLTTRNEEDTAAMLLVIAKREYEAHGNQRPHIRKPYQPVNGQQEQVIASFPDIGLKNARLLLGHFGSVQGIVNADEQSLGDVEGVGRKGQKRSMNCPGTVTAEKTGSTLLFLFLPYSSGRGSGQGRVRSRYVP